MTSLRRIELSDIKLNMIFSAPVFFEDGKNMFLAGVPYLLSRGQAIEQGEGSNIERMTGFDKRRLAQAKMTGEDSDDIEELEEL